MTIKHIVFSGGGPIAIKVLGIIQHLEENKFWNIDNIESIYATSAGCSLAVLLCLRYDWETIRSYFIKRPWQEAYPIKPEHILNAYNSKGIFNINFFQLFFKPFFDAKNISHDITMIDFYNYSKIEVHFFSVELNEYKLCDISYKTHPTLPLITAIYMSCAVPILFAPVCFDGKCFIDGGVLNNYPLENCLNDHPAKDEIMSFKNDYMSVEPINKSENYIVEESNLFDYVGFMLKQVIANLYFKEIPSIPNEIICTTECMTLDNFKLTLESQQFRQNFFDQGIQTAIDFLDKITVDVVTTL